MATMNVSLPDQMKNWVEQQGQGGRYSNSSEYIRDLIRQDQDRATKIRKMQELVNEGRDSGISQKPMSEIRADARKQAGIS